jgi:hypothetical protein
MRLRFPIPIAVLAGAVGIGAVSIAGAQAPSLQPAAIDETTFSVVLNGANEFPGPGDTDGTGQASITINPETGRVCVNIVTANIGEMTNGLHIHPGAPGEANAPLIDFDVTSGTSVSKCVTEDAAGDAQSILDAPEDFYLNAHTAAFPAGAIRGQLAEVQSSAGELRLLDTPVRAYDSRPASSTDGKLVAGTPRIIDLSDSVPAASRGVMVTLTVTQTVGVGFVTAYSAALPTFPATSTINWRAADSDVATTTTVAVSADSKIALRAGDNGTHVIVDVIGYYL